MSEQESSNPYALFDSLRLLGKTLRQQGEQPFNNAHGHNAPPLTVVDLAATAERLAAKFNNLDWSSLSKEEIDEYFDDLKGKVEVAITSLAPNVHSTAHVPEAILTLLFSIDVQISSRITEDVVDQSLRLPQSLRRNVNTARRRLDGAMSAVENIDTMIGTINSAYSAASNLPAAQSDLEQALRDTETARTAIINYQAESKRLVEESVASKVSMDDLIKRANEVMNRVDHAYRASTSDGLARAFAKKARLLGHSMYIWTAILIGSLAAAVMIGSERFPAILAAAAISSVKPSWGYLIVQVALAALSMGAPIWLGWVATKQLGQRFRLAEDYAYKAALASAYEGYRSEAVNIDPLMQAQLFSIALNRLDEIPLRLVEHDVPGSPFHELIKSIEFKEATRQVPGLTDRVLKVLRRAPEPKLGPATNESSNEPLRQQG